MHRLHCTTPYIAVICVNVHSPLFALWTSQFSIMCTSFVKLSATGSKLQNRKWVFNNQVRGPEKSRLQNIFVQSRLCNHNKHVISSVSIFCIRDGIKKSKWKFKMAFAMKGGRPRSRLCKHYTKTMTLPMSPWSLRILQAYKSTKLFWACAVTFSAKHWNKTQTLILSYSCKE